jgi:UDP-N-acetylglucosamine 4,6-dehydratase/5-epimerase
MIEMLITGGTGSLGQKLVPHFLKRRYKITVISRDEDKQSRMMKEYPDVKFILGDVRDLRTCYDAVKDKGIVIHAAALKRIEMCETNPWESIQTNVIGTRNMVYASKHEGVPYFVLISTDKACKPINTYGMCKALGEKITVSAGYNCVRYGNVNNSRGSVLPYWKKLSEEGKKIPVTNQDMSRFLIDFDKAIWMIELALEEMCGCIYIPKLDSANIGKMAMLFGDMEIIGERPGEKLFEELINSEEFRGRVEEKKDHFIIHHDKKFKEFRDRSYRSMDSLSPALIRERLREFLPTGTTK